MDSDLSEYERLRLVNIQRNAEFLKQLGLEISKPVSVKRSIEPKERKHQNIKQRTKRTVDIQPTRKSKRIRELPPSNLDESVISDHSDEEATADERIDYEEMPIESSDLDDSEFEIYADLKKWRLLKSRELGIEAYKICQNRTIAELIRRRRNDIDWASANKSNEDITNDLLQCWGVGPSKARDHHGFIFDMNMHISDSEPLLTLLEQSRKQITSQEEGESQ